MGHRKIDNAESAPEAPALESVAADAASPAAPVPSIPANPSEDDKARWRESSAMDVASLLLEPEAIKSNTTAMVVIDYELNGGAGSETYFRRLLSDANLPLAGEKRLMAATTLGSRLDRGDPADGAKAGKILDEMASAAEGLLAIVHERAMPLYYTPECVAELRRIISEYTYRKLADRARNEDLDAKPRGVLALDRAKVREIAVRLVEQRTRELSATALAFAARDEKGNLVELPGFTASQAEIAEKLADFDISNGLVASLWELCQAARAIALEATDRMKVPGADPKDKKAERRKTEAHILLRPDGSIVISAYGTNASNVVHIGGVTGLLASPPAFDVLIPPQVHKKLALNLEKPAQRNATRLTEEAPAPDTKLVATYRLRSEAALNPAYGLSGAGLAFSLYRPTYGHKGDPEDHILNVRASRTWNVVGYFERAEAAGGFTARIAASAERFVHAAKKRKAVALTICGSEMAVTIPVANEELRATLVKPSELSVYVAAADLQPALAMFASMGIRGKLELAVDNELKALRWSFGHRGHAYCLYMPCTGAAGSRLTDAFESLAVIREKTTAPARKAA